MLDHTPLQDCWIFVYSGSCEERMWRECCFGSCRKKEIEELPVVEDGKFEKEVGEKNLEEEDFEQMDHGWGRLKET